MVRHAGHLRQVSNGENLAHRRQPVQLICDGLGCPSAHSRIHFVEDQHGNVFMPCKNALHRQHDARKLTAEAILLKGRSGSPGLGEIMNSALSIPWRVRRMRRPSTSIPFGSSSVSSLTSREVRSICRSFSSPSTCDAKSAAHLRRASLSFFAEVISSSSRAFRLTVSFSKCSSLFSSRSVSREICS